MLLLKAFCKTSVGTYDATQGCILHIIDDDEGISITLWHATPLWGCRLGLSLWLFATWPHTWRHWLHLAVCYLATRMVQRAKLYITPDGCTYGIHRSLFIWLCRILAFEKKSTLGLTAASLYPWSSLCVSSVCVWANGHLYLQMQFEWFHFLLYLVSIIISFTM